MTTFKVTSLFSRLDELELSLCLFFNRACHRRNIERFFVVISRLGDGIFWYCLMLVFAILDYPDGLKAALHMGAVAIIGLLIYKQTKGRMARMRPSMTWAQIQRHCTARYLQLSFRSYSARSIVHYHRACILPRALVAAASFFYPGGAIARDSRIALPNRCSRRGGDRRQPGLAQLQFCLLMQIGQFRHNS